MDNMTRNLIAAVQDLSKTNPRDPKVAKIVEYIDGATAKIAGTHLSFDELKSHVVRLQQAATIPAKNYTRMVSITAGLNRALELSKLPENAALQPRIATLVNKVAGIFALCDTADKLSEHTLEQIEQAIHSLYSNGKMNDPNTYNFEARGKGHHTKG